MTKQEMISFLENLSDQEIGWLFEELTQGFDVEEGGVPVYPHFLYRAMGKWHGWEEFAERMQRPMMTPQDWVLACKRFVIRRN